MFPIKLIFIFSILLFFNLTIFIKSNQIIFPFKTEEIKSDSLDYIEEIQDNKIYITTQIGNPPQKIKLYLTMNTCFLLIANSSIDSSYYNNENSKTYVNITKSTPYFEIFTNAYLSKENFFFQTSYDNTKIKEFNNIEFMHVLEYSTSEYISPGYFGLQLPKKNKMNIFDNLKKSNVISSYIFNINYTSDNEGFLSIGEFPSQYNDNVEKEKDAIKKTNALPCSNDHMSNNDLCWQLKFNDVKFGDIKVNRDREAEIMPELGFIKGTKEYQTKIEENYFNKYHNNTCKLNNYGSFFYYYECDKNIDISSFKDLIFSHQEFMYDFVLTKNDLFKEYKDKLYFLIVFDYYLNYGNNWKLGKPFIKKYNLVYDADKKLIYYYDNQNTNKKEKEKEKENENENGGNSKTFIYWIIIGFLGIAMIVMIALVLTKVIFKPKKKQANELKEDNYYINQDDKENSLGVS